MNLQVFKPDLERAEEPEIKLSTSAGTLLLFNDQIYIYKLLSLVGELTLYYYIMSIFVTSDSFCQKATLLDRSWPFLLSASSDCM